MKKISLNGNWCGKCISETGNSFEFIGEVPGSSINDLINAGKLPDDIFYGRNADTVKEFENCVYIYTRSFDYDLSSDYDMAELCFERLDTYCDVYLNGEKLGHRENGNISHSFDVSGKLIYGKNTVEIRFYSPILSVNGKKPRSGAFTTERLYTRRTQCTYGWDWVARFVSCGIGDAFLRLQKSDEVIPDGVYIYTKCIDDESASVGVDITFGQKYRGRVMRFEFISPDGAAVIRIDKYCEEGLIRLCADIPEAQLWYPLGYGEHPLYTFKIFDGECEIYSEEFGIRTVKIQQIPDKPDSEEYRKCLSVKNPEYDENSEFSGFILKVNGVKIMCKGANWVPCEPFENGRTETKIPKVLSLAAEAGVNMLRVWGGGAFEKPCFYKECSRLGIMVTQDFLMACGSYPEEENWFIESLKSEAQYAARFIRNYPCLMWWSGDNENAVHGSDRDKDYRGRRSAYKGIAPVLYALDPYREFLPSSPFGGNKYASNTVGTTHNTQFLSEFFKYIDKTDLSDYKEEFKKYRARFIAEEPQMGAAGLHTLRRIMSDNDIFGKEDGMWKYHTKTNPFLSKELFDYMSEFAEKILGGFENDIDRCFKLQYIQYEWLRVVMEQARREKWFCSGIIFWMLNDCWPAAAGWSLIDYYNVPKAAYYSFRRCAGPIVGSFDRRDGVLYLDVVNDTTETVKVVADVWLLKNGVMEKLTDPRAGTSIAGGGKAVLLEYRRKLDDDEMLIAEIGSSVGNDRTFYINRNPVISKCGVKSDVDKERRLITVSAPCDKYIHAVQIEGDILPDDNYFSLMPGEVRTVGYRLIDGASDDNIGIAGYTLKNLVLNEV